MSKQDLKSLKAECEKQSLPSLKDASDQGETVWLIGLPAPAEDGMIGISLDESLRVVIREEDILEVVKDANYYLLKTKRHANLVVQHQSVVQLDPQPECGCGSPEQFDDRNSGENGYPKASKLAGPPIFGGTGSGDRYPCWQNCKVRWKCTPYIDGDGRVRWVCVPYLDCENVCQPA
jgi:hypothetical protein